MLPDAAPSITHCRVPQMGLPESSMLTVLCSNLLNVLWATPCAGAALAHWLLMIRGQQAAKAQKVLALQWRLVQQHAQVFTAWQAYAHKLQVCHTSCCLECDSDVGQKIETDHIIPYFTCFSNLCANVKIPLAAAFIQNQN